MSKKVKNRILGLMEPIRSINRTVYEVLSDRESGGREYIFSLLEQVAEDPSHVWDIKFSYDSRGSFKRCYVMTISTSLSDDIRLAFLVGYHDATKEGIKSRLFGLEYGMLCQMYEKVPEHFPNPIDLKAAGFFYEEDGGRCLESRDVFIAGFVEGEHIDSLIDGANPREKKKIVFAEGAAFGKTYVRTNRYLFDPKGDNVKVQVSGKHYFPKIVDVGFMVPGSPFDLIRHFCGPQKTREEIEHMVEMMSFSKEEEHVRKEYLLDPLMFERPELRIDPSSFFEGLRSSMGDELYDEFLAAVYLEQKVVFITPERAKTETSEEFQSRLMERFEQRHIPRRDLGALVSSMLNNENPFGKWVAERIVPFSSEIGLTH